MADKFDAIVVGAGPAGCAAAYRMAKAGLSVLVLERGKYPGAKNSSGAILYGKILEDLIPNFWDEAPVERWIASQTVVALHNTQSVEMKFNYDKSQRLIVLSVLRSQFDRWFADKAKEAGALILCSTLATDVLKRGGKTVGVTVAKGQGEVYADVVLATDGVNSLIAEKEKLRNPFRLKDLALGVKEVIKFPAKEIEKRFHLSGNEGAAYTFVGEVTQGFQGGGFLYTNRESLSIGVVVQLSSLKHAGIKPFEFLDLFKENPHVAPLVDGAALREYSAHLIPEGAYHMVPRLYADGIMLGGDAAAFALNGGFIVRGIDFAIASGMAAADTIIRAKDEVISLRMLCPITSSCSNRVLFWVISKSFAVSQNSGNGTNL